MKKVLRIEMADDNNIYEVGFGKELSVKPDGEGFSTFEGDEEINYFRTEQQAIYAKDQDLIDDNLIIKGFGKHSGLKFWQLPETLKREVLRLSKAA